MFASPSETLAALESAGYFTDIKTATAVYLAGRIHPRFCSRDRLARVKRNSLNLSRVPMACPSFACSAIRALTKKRPSDNMIEGSRNSTCSS